MTASRKKSMNTKRSRERQHKPVKQRNTKQNQIKTKYKTKPKKHFDMLIYLFRLYAFDS